MPIAQRVGIARPMGNQHSRRVKQHPDNVDRSPLAHAYTSNVNGSQTAPASSLMEGWMLRKHPTYGYASSAGSLLTDKVGTPEVEQGPYTQQNPYSALYASTARPESIVAERSSRLGGQQLSKVAGQQVAGQPTEFGLLDTIVEQPFVQPTTRAQAAAMMRQQAFRQGQQNARAASARVEDNRRQPAQQELRAAESMFADRYLPGNYTGPDAAEAALQNTRLPEAMYALDRTREQELAARLAAYQPTQGMEAASELYEANETPGYARDRAAMQDFRLSPGGDQMADRFSRLMAMREAAQQQQMGQAPTVDNRGTQIGRPGAFSMVRPSRRKTDQEIAESGYDPNDVNIVSPERRRGINWPKWAQAAGKSPEEFAGLMNARRNRRLRDMAVRSGNITPARESALRDAGVPEEILGMAGKAARKKALKKFFAPAEQGNEGNERRSVRSEQIIRGQSLRAAARGDADPTDEQRATLGLVASTGIDTADPSPVDVVSTLRKLDVNNLDDAMAKSLAQFVQAQTANSEDQWAEGSLLFRPTAKEQEWLAQVQEIDGDDPEAVRGWLSSMPETAMEGLKNLPKQQKWAVPFVN